MFGPSRRELSRQLERERMRNQEYERELLNRLMYVTGHTWELPPPVPLDPGDDDGGEDVSFSSLHGLPPGYEEG